MSKVVVLAGGSTVLDYMKMPNHLGVDFHPNMPFIAVNDAYKMFNVNMVVTMDRRWLEYRVNDLLTMLDVGEIASVYARKSTQQNMSPLAKSEFRWFENKNTSEALDFSPVLEKLNGSNSGVVALNLAAKFRPEKIYMLGFDMKQRDGRAYWYEPYPWAKDAGTAKPGKYKGWAKEFRMIRDQMRTIGAELVNVTHDSAIPASVIPWMSYEKFMEETRA